MQVEGLNHGLYHHHEYPRGSASHHPDWGSIEVEVRSILEQAAQPAERIKFDAMLTAIACEAGGLTEIEAEAVNQQREKTPAEPMRFE